MALTKSVSKTSVTERMPKMWVVSLTLIVTDDNGPGFMRSFSQNYKKGKPLPDLAAAFQAEMQAAIGKYKEEQVYYNHEQLDAVVAAVELGLEV